MKKLLINLIKLYQRIPLKVHANCKYVPTCSNYAITVINEYGTIKGLFLTTKRIIRCNPFHKGGIDLPPKKEKL